MNNRVDAIKLILDRHKTSFFVLSNGLTSREASYFHGDARCFYMLHAMGESLSVGIGLALAKPSTSIVVIDGDYNALMGLSSWAMMPINNLIYYVLANGTSETTGGQCLPSLPFIPEWCNVVNIQPGKSITPNPPAPITIWANTQHWLSPPT